MAALRALTAKAISQLESHIIVLGQCCAAGNPGERSTFSWFSSTKNHTSRSLSDHSIAKLLHVSSQPKGTCETITGGLKKRVSAAKSDSAALYPISRRFRHSGWLSRTSRWSAVAGGFGLSASEGQFYRCPVSHPIPVKK